MNIGITCYPVAGGSGIVATELGQQLAMRGHKIHFVTYALPFRLDQYQANVFYHEVETTAYPLFKFPPYTLTLAAKMAEVTRNFDLDVIHVHYAIPHATCAFLAKQIMTEHGTRMPKIITTLHGTDITLVSSTTNLETNIITWTLGTIPVDSYAILTYQIKTPTSSANPGELKFNATWDSDRTDVESEPFKIQELR